MGVGENVLSRICKRKEARRNRKKLKKMQNVAHASHKKIEDVVTERLSHNILETSEIGKRKKLKGQKNEQPKSESTEKSRKKKRRKSTNPMAKAEKRRREDLLKSLEEDEAQIKRYGTLLGYKKRKSKNLPQVFRAEGLDYILELCDDPSKIGQLSDEEQSGDSDLEVEKPNETAPDMDDIDLSEHSDIEMDKMDSKKKSKSGKRVSFAEEPPESFPPERRQNDDGTDGGDDDDVLSESGSEQASEMSDNDNESGKNMDDDAEDNDNAPADDIGDGSEDEASQTKEDIYGRLVNKKSGEIVSKGVDSRQRLAQLAVAAHQNPGINDAERIKLEKNIRGIVNRLNENTIVSLVKSVNDLFVTHSHNDVKQCLFDALYKSIAVGYRLPDRIVVEYALFMALIHSTVSVELSTHFVESFILRIVDLIVSPPDDKYLENASIFLAEIYNFKIIKGSMVGEILDRMKATITDKLMECIKLILSYCGGILKSRDSDVLQRSVSDIQLQLSSLPKERLDNEPHVRFMVEEFMEIKNANIRKWTDSVDRTIFDHYMSIFRGLTKKVDKENELGMSVDDIVHIEERGRWWLVGSAWQPALTTSDGAAATAAASSSSQSAQISGPTNLDVDTKFDGSLLALAKKAHMNTALRKSIFCTLLSSKDEMDAFEQLMRLSLKGHQERQILHICLHCALRETAYNPFYAAVLTQFCAFHKRFKLTTQYAIWDRIREMNGLEQWQRRHLASIIADLILNRSIGITVLKVIEFGTIDRLTTRFLRRILTTILTRASESNLAEIFGHIISSPKHKLFSQGLQLFIQMAINKDAEQADKTLLRSRISFIESLWEHERL